MSKLLISFGRTSFAARLALFLCSAATVTACTVGPRYAPPGPPPPSAAGAFTSQAPAIADPNPPPPNWWELYNVPVIDRLVQDALTRNKNLLVAAANLTEARAALSQARAGRYPTTSLSGGVSYGVSTDQQIVTSIENKTPKPDTVIDGGLDVSYEIDLFGRIHRLVQAASADYEARKAAEDAARISVAAETTRAYVNACAYAEELSVAQETLSLVTQTYQVTLKEAQAGAASDFDIARARALVEQTRSTLPTYEGQRRTALFQLAVLTGQPPEEISQDANTCKSPPKLARVLPVGDGTSLLRRRPDVRQAERQIAADVARIGVATADLYPTISLGGSVASSGTSLSQLGSADGLTYGFGPLINWTFPNTLVAQAQIREARAVASADYANFQATVLQALQDTETALTAYGAELDRNGALIAARDQSQIAFKLAGVRFQNGSASYLDVLSAESDLVNASASLAASDEALASDQVTVFKALGGGWEQAPDIQPLPIPDGRKPGKEIKVH
jgi:NodT family efflux transporter outer membrane factor (OMF) lipoprotein